MVACCPLRPVLVWWLVRSQTSGSGQIQISRKRIVFDEQTLEAIFMREKRLAWCLIDGK